MRWGIHAALCHAASAGRGEANHLARRHRPVGGVLAARSVQAAGKGTGTREAPSPHSTASASPRREATGASRQKHEYPESMARPLPGERAERPG
jgi:hypothetical protein